MASDLGNLGVIAQIRGDLDKAEEYYQRSLAIEEELGRKEGMASDLGNLEGLAQRRGDLARAEEYHWRALAIDEELGHKEGMAADLGNLGNVARIRGDLTKAEEYHRQSTTGSPSPSMRNWGARRAWRRISAISGSSPRPVANWQRPRNTSASPSP